MEGYQGSATEEVLCFALCRTLPFCHLQHYPEHKICANIAIGWNTHGNSPDHLRLARFSSCGVNAHVLRADLFTPAGDY